MPRKLRAPKQRNVLHLPADLVTATHLAWLAGGGYSDGLDALIWAALDEDGENFETPDPPAPRPWLPSGITGRDLWTAMGEPYAAKHVKQHPGTRHPLWWRFDAPEPRRRLGGIGEPSSKCAHFLEQSYLGIPIHWFTPADIDAAAAATLQPITVPAIDPKFPPLFESEAAYLDRLGLLTAAEGKHLGPDEFSPVTIIEILGLHERERAESDDLARGEPDGSGPY